MMKTMRRYLEKRQRNSREVLMMVYLHKRGEGIWNYSGRGDFVKTASTSLTSPRYMKRDCSTSDTILKMELFLGFLFWHWLWFCTLTVRVNHVEYVMNYGCLLNYQGVLSTKQIFFRDWVLSKESIKSSNRSDWRSQARVSIMSNLSLWQWFWNNQMRPSITVSLISW